MIWKDRNHQVENRYFHHALVKISSSILYHFHSNYLLCLQILTLDHLPERTLPKDVKDKISISAP